MAGQWVWQSPLSHLHPHPLIPIESDSWNLCSGCWEDIFGKFPIYQCNNKDCWFVLHKECAEGQRDINHPRHSQHTLTLLLNPPFQSSSSSCLCEVCRHECKYLSYYCSQCEFGIHKSCAFKEQTIQHPGHTHTLSMFLQRPLLFECDACGMEYKDKAYGCIPCQFCIHVGCAWLSRVFTSPHHEHPLNQSYFYTSKYSLFSPICVICNEVVKSSDWCYSCNQCRYLVHLRCTRSEQRENERKITAEEKDFDNNADLISLPIDIFADTANLYVNRISHFVTKMGLEDTKTTTTTTINHFSHDHPLQYFEEQNKEKENDQSSICEGCRQPISAPFYKCAAECGFFLHKCCANFPQKVRHPLHPDHMLSFSWTINAPNFGVCTACNKPCHGFILMCEEDGCDGFYLDLVCASLLNSVITHKAHHKHPLLPMTTAETTVSCNVCGRYISTSHWLRCDTCNFDLHISCAMLPLAIRHRWDKHPLILSYPPFIHHREEFYCEYCEKEMNPNKCLYHCRDCDQSFHLDCLRGHDQFSNIKYKSTAIAQCEGHKFREAEAIEDESQCHVCLQMTKDKLFKCSQCNFLICDICYEEFHC